MHTEASLQTDIARALHTILTGICREPDDLELLECRNGKKTIISCKSGNNDYRILVGREGKTVHAIQRIVTRAGRESGHWLQFDLLTNGVGDNPTLKPFVANPNFNEAIFIRLLKDLLAAAGVDSAGLEMRKDPTRLHALVPAKSIEDRATLSDCNTLFFAWGYRQGRKISIHSK